MKNDEIINESTAAPCLTITLLPVVHSYVLQTCKHTLILAYSIREISLAIQYSLDILNKKENLPLKESVIPYISQLLIRDGMVTPKHTCNLQALLKRYEK